MRPAIRYKPLLLAILIALGFGLLLRLNYRSAPPHPRPLHFHFEQPYFSAHITAYGDSLALTQAMQSLDSWFRDFHNRYRSNGTLDSLIYHANAGDAIPLDSLDFAVFDFALKFRDYTRGDIDVGIGNLLRAWKEAAAAGVALDDSTRQSLVADLETPFYRMDPENRSLIVLKPHRHFALGAFLEGVLLDEIGQRLHSAGSTAWLAEISGDFAFHGIKPQGEPWVLGVRDPQAPEELLCTVRMIPSMESFCTSGDYEQQYTDKNGKKHHHILNPRTGESVRGIRSASVTQAIPGMNKNSLCTWFMTLSLPRIQEEVQRANGKIEALIVLDSGRVWISPGLRQRTTMLKPEYQLID